MADPILCVKCKRPVRAEAEFCPSCGQRLKKRCVSTACDAVLSFADTHCPKCGTKQSTSFLNPQLAGEAMKAAPDLIKGGLGCLKDFAMLIGIPGIVVIAILWVLNSLTGGWIFNLLFGWIWTLIGGWVVLALLAFVGYQIYKRGLLGRVMQSARESGQRNRARRLEQQRQRAEENARQAVLHPIAPPAPVQPTQLPPPEVLAHPVVPSSPAARRPTRRARVVQSVPSALVGFAPAVIEAQVRRITVRLGGNRAQAELIVREAIAELSEGQDFSVTTLFKMVNDVLLRQA